MFFCQNKKNWLFPPSLIWLLFFLVLSGSVWAQAPKKITGKVTDDAGQPVSGASIMVKGSRSAVTAGADGTFTITAKEKDVIVVSYIGYQDKEISVSGNTLTVAMVKSDKSMDDVVVIGFGTQKRQNVTAAVATMDAKSIQEKPITRIDQAMIGQMPGVVVRQQTGLPGQGFTLLVRGTGSISAGTEPLYVIDGFPLDVNSQNTAGGFSNGNPLNNLNPDDIESIQVLKDAAAGAIYGSRAANGVVLVTTKRGQIGKTHIGINANAGVPEKKNTYLSNGHNFQDDRLRLYLPGNGGLLSAIALMCAGYDGTPGSNPGFPQDGTWKVRWEGLNKMP